MKAPMAWLFIGAFLAFCTLFLVAPAAMLAVQSVSGDDRSCTRAGCRSRMTWPNGWRRSGKSAVLRSIHMSMSWTVKPRPFAMPAQANLPMSGAAVF